MTDLTSCDACGAIFRIDPFEVSLYSPKQEGFEIEGDLCDKCVNSARAWLHSFLDEKYKKGKKAK